MERWTVRNTRVANEGRTFEADVMIGDGVIERIAAEGIGDARRANEVDVKGCLLIPGAIDEKAQLYRKCPSGGPLVQHALPAMLELVHQGVFTVEQVVEKMCHAPARMFQVSRRGFVREGHFADLVLVDMDSPWTVMPDNILYKCRWSPFEGQRFRSRVLRTWVNGRQVYHNGIVDRSARGKRLSFDR